MWRERGYGVAVLQDRVRFDCPADVIITTDHYPGWAGSVNRLFRDAVPRSARIIVAIGDDMHPDPNRSASDIGTEFLEYFAHTPGGSLGVMQPVGDAFEATRRICGSPWLGRAWMERMYRGTGGMCDRYHHQWADDELYWVARCTGSLWARADLVQHHDHFRRRGASAPGYWVNSVARHDRADCLTFIARAHAGFPGAEAIGADAPVLAMEHFHAHYQHHAEATFAARYAGSSSDEPARRLSAALDRCASEGWGRVGVFGAGQHTRRAADALCTPPVAVLCIVDEDPARIGTRLWGIDIVGIEHAIEHATAGKLDAIVLSSDAMEPNLRRACAPLAEMGVPIIGLYEELEIASARMSEAPSAAVAG